MVASVVVALVLIGVWLVIIGWALRDLDRPAPPRAAGLKGKELRIR